MTIFCILKRKSLSILALIALMLINVQLKADGHIDLNELNELAYKSPEQLLKKLEKMDVDSSVKPLRHQLQVIKAKALYYSNRFTESQTILIAVEADFNEINDHSIKELTLRFMGQNFYRMGGFDQAMTYALKAKLIADEHSLVAASAQITNMIAAIHLRSGEHEMAKKYFTEALTNFEAIKAMNDVAKVNNNLAAVYIESQDYVKAESYLSQALSLATELNRPTTFMSAIVNQIEFKVKMGQFESAQKSYEDCLVYTEAENIRSFQVWCLEAGVDLLKVQGKYTEAIAIAVQAYGMMESQKLSQSQINMGKVLIELYENTNQLDKALQVSVENLTLIEAVKTEILSLKLEEIKALNEVEKTQNQLQFEREQNKLYLANQRLTMVGLAILIPILLIALYLLHSKKKVLQALHAQKQQTEDALEDMRIAKESHEKLAKTDVLTGLNNRREMLNILEKYMEKKGQIKYVMMLDLDKFKRINDDYGHAIGDQILQHLSTVIQNWLPENAHCARWGGEEFLVLLRGMSVKQVNQYSVNLLEQVSQIKLEQYPMLTTSLSAGICEFRDGLTIDQWIRQADEALYISKSNGRNQFTLSTE